jgi:hypothetical protein
MTYFFFCNNWQREVNSHGPDYKDMSKKWRVSHTAINVADLYGVQVNEVCVSGLCSRQGIGTLQLAHMIISVM